MEEILTPSEVASLLKMHVNTVYRLVEEGLVPGNKIGRAWRFRKKDILQLISRKQGKKSRSNVTRVAVADPKRNPGAEKSR